MREAIKAFEDTLTAGDASARQSAYQAVCAIIDRTAQKGVIHRSQAARRKSRLSVRLKASASA
jgi:small subunit ribosomal protein S20